MTPDNAGYYYAAYVAAAVIYVGYALSLWRRGRRTRVRARPERDEARNADVA